MKKLFITALIAAAAFTSAFAEPASVNKNVLARFNADFKKATNISWKLTDDYAKASFTLNKENFEVFYNNNGDLIASGKIITVTDLPQKAQKRISEKYADFVATEIVELTSEDNEINYYVSLKGSNKIVILKVTPDGDSQLYKTVK